LKRPDQPDGRANGPDLLGSFGAWFARSTNSTEGGAGLPIVLVGSRTSDHLARRLLELVGSLPNPVWGRDQLGTGEMWNSNSVTAWLLARSGLPTDAIRPPAGGRAPGWQAGLATARRQQASDEPGRHGEPSVTTTMGGPPGAPPGEWSGRVASAKNHATGRAATSRAGPAPAGRPG
jgi:hypothetical protein